MQGHAGADVLSGELGNDRLAGGKGQDQLYGGGGSDVLLGLKGKDRLFGGAGADVFARGHGADRILDFTPGEDLIDLSGIFGRGMGFEDLEISRSAAGTRIDTGAGRVLLEDLRPAELDADDFLF
ncbi:hypothetical protein PXK00_16730 [Phaeobacter sp. QD34_3]|uniref:hypothetical protein n=1 Tax=unclassified Phaeobacter TaxID=2621772 RepID=UPI00237F34EC|nr:MULTISPECIES: hypothetical protein [unclassified Phaeobacter]MDE4134765.1 hypothetical protein [Phaeobacter sp. QD34_3]MDE4138423.1 hypothetical protein [Phaeobacter sp. QD34_24]